MDNSNHQSSGASEFRTKLKLVKRQCLTTSWLKCGWSGRKKAMVNTCICFYVHEFIDDLMYFNEKYGDIFECDGDNLEVLSTFNRGEKTELH